MDVQQTQTTAIKHNTNRHQLRALAIQAAH